MRYFFAFFLLIAKDSHFPSLFSPISSSSFLFHFLTSSLFFQMTSIESLKTRLDSLEKLNLSKEDVSTEVLSGIQSYQAQLLPRLKEIREAMEKELASGQHVQPEETIALREENKKLKAEVEKLNYRVRHLVKMLEEEEQKSK